MKIILKTEIYNFNFWIESGVIFFMIYIFIMLRDVRILLLVWFY